MAMAEKNRYTIADIYALPEGERAELIDGVLYDQAAPSRVHQRIVTELATSINQFIRENGKNCEVYVSPFAVFLEDDDYNYVEPDLSVICDTAKLGDDGCHGAPDWIIEIVSPSSLQMDYMRKLFKYQKTGVRLYWIVDPSDRAVIVYHFDADTMGRYSFDDAVPVGICEGLSIRISDRLT